MSLASQSCTAFTKACYHVVQNNCNKKPDDMTLLHRRFGHPSFIILMYLLKSCPKLKVSQNSSAHSLCEAYQLGKVHKQHFSTTETKTKSVLELIHTDLWGPSPTVSRNGYKYYISFINDYNRYTLIYPLKLKSEAFEVSSCLNFKWKINSILKLRCCNLIGGRGGEYRVFTDFLNQNEIHFRHSCPYTHQQNSLVERKHRRIVELGLTLLAQANLPFKFWWDAVHTTVYHINKLPTPILNFPSPYEKLFNHKPDYSFLKCFGCLCYPYLRDFNKHKFDFQTSKCIFIGYSPSHKNYKCLTSSGQVHILRHVTFDETVFPYSTDNVFNLSQCNKNSETPVSVSHFSPQQVYHLSNYPYLIAALKISTQQAQQDINKHLLYLYIQIFHINKSKVIMLYQNHHHSLYLYKIQSQFKHNLKIK